MPATMTAPRKTKRNARKAEPVRDAPAWNSVYINAVALPDGSTLVPWRPAFYLAERDGDGYALRDESIALDVYAPTVPELEAEAKSEIAFLWREYALADDDTLSLDALALKRTLLARFEAIPGHV